MPNFDLICKSCGEELYNFKKGLSKPFPSCLICGHVMQRNWKSMGTPSISWKGPGGSPLVGGRPSKKNFNTNEKEVEQEMYNSITETEDE